MSEVETRLKEWGNSIGIVIPKEVLQEEGLKVNQNVKVMIKPVKTLKVRDLFGKLKEWKKPTKQIMKEVREELDSKFF